MKVKKFVNSGYHLGYRYIKKSRGPNIDPWGIPTVTGIISDLHGLCNLYKLRVVTKGNY